MKDLAGYRLYARTYLELDEQELPNTLIDSWLGEGYTNIIRKIRRQPHFQMESTVTTNTGVRGYVLPSTMENVVSIEGQWGQLEYMGYSDARDRFHLYGGSVTQGRARVWSVWAGKIQVFPLPDASETLTVVGWRAPEDWIAAGSGSAPDMPASYEPALLSYLMYKANVHQDDPDRASADLRDFENHLNTAIAFETGAPSAAGMVLGGGLRPRGLPNRLAYPWE